MRVDQLTVVFAAAAGRLGATRTAVTAADRDLHRLALIGSDAIADTPVSPAAPRWRHTTDGLHRAAEHAVAASLDSLRDDELADAWLLALLNVYFATGASDQDLQRARQAAAQLGGFLPDSVHDRPLFNDLAWTLSVWEDAVDGGIGPWHDVVRPTCSPADSVAWLIDRVVDEYAYQGRVPPTWLERWLQTPAALDGLNRLLASRKAAAAGVAVRHAVDRSRREGLPDGVWASGVPDQPVVWLGHWLRATDHGSPWICHVVKDSFDRWLQHVTPQLRGPSAHPRADAHLLLHPL